MRRPLRAVIDAIRIQKQPESWLMNTMQIIIIITDSTRL
jgi:hypothetical protein